MGKTNKLHTAVEAYVRKELLAHLPSTYLFHNFEHVTEVVNVVQKLSKSSCSYWLIYSLNYNAL